MLIEIHTLMQMDYRTTLGISYENSPTWNRPENVAIDRLVRTRYTYRCLGMQ